MQHKVYYCTDIIYSNTALHVVISISILTDLGMW